MLAPVLGNGVNFMRVMPVMSAVESNTRTASYDELATIIEKARRFPSARAPAAVHAA